MKLLAPLAVLLTLAAPAAQAVVVGFDDLSDSGPVADGYGGITWGGNWVYYDSAQDPYNPSSDFQRIYADYSSSGSVFLATSFSFAVDAVFDGAFFAGRGRDEGHLPVYFELFLNGISVAISSALDMNSTPTFLGSGYSGLVDEVVVWGERGFYIMDDVTYNTSAVPVPAAGFLLFGALGGLALLRRRKMA